MSYPKTTVTNLVCVSYQSNSFLLPHHFIGHTEAEARQKLQDWLSGKPGVSGFPKIKMGSGEAPKPSMSEEPDTSDIPEAGPEFFEKAKLVMPEKSSEEKSGRGVHFAGKIWMVHFGKHLKVRIDPSDEQAYKDMGYVRGGPKTKFK